MPTPAITASTRYFDRAVTKIYYLPAVAATNLTPTRAEMNAGTDLSPQVVDWGGWTLAADQINTPDLGTLFNGKIPGALDAEDSSLTLHASQNGVDVRALLPRGTSGYIMWLDGGDTSGNKADVYPVRVRSCSKQRSMSDSARVIVQFSITSTPGENVTVPA